MWFTDSNFIEWSCVTTFTSTDAFLVECFWIWQVHQALHLEIYKKLKLTIIFKLLLYSRPVKYSEGLSFDLIICQSLQAFGNAVRNLTTRFTFLYHLACIVMLKTTVIPLCDTFTYGIIPVCGKQSLLYESSFQQPCFVLTCFNQVLATIFRDRF